MSAIKFKLVRVADGAEFPINGNLLVGRLDECDLRITQGLPSRRHAQLTMVDQSVWVEDLGSANGTYINGVRIAAKSPLSAGDLLRFDLEEFHFRDVAASVSAPTMYRPLKEVVKELAQSEAAPITPPPSPVSAPASVEVPKAPVAPERSPEKSLEKSPAPPSREPIQEGSGVFKRPGAWADPDHDDGANKTKFMDPAALKGMLNAPKIDRASGSVDVPSLVVMSGAASGASINLQGQRNGVAEWTIGSGADCQVVIADGGVSALHAKLVNDGTRWKLIDQMSANGTYVNGKRSTVSYLSSGDRIVLGPVECEIRLPHSARVASVTTQIEPRKNKSMLIVAAVGGALVLLGIVWAIWLK
jgi:pSer/pThr/pTyr-binding forkhead associated (FHA) protein